MCGMIPNWNSYNDAMNSVSKPLQMGPVWMHAGEVTQVQMRYDIWHRDPPSSSFPPCLAVKTAGLQSDRAEDEYLFELRRYMMEEGANISKTQVLFEVAARTESVDPRKFREDWDRGAGKARFREDLQKARFHGIGRFPTLTFLNEEGKGVMIVGYRPFEVLQQAFAHVAKDGIAMIRQRVCCPNDLLTARYIREPL